MTATAGATEVAAMRDAAMQKDLASSKAKARSVSRFSSSGGVEISMQNNLQPGNLLQATAKPRKGKSFKAAPKAIGSADVPAQAIQMTYNLEGYQYSNSAQVSISNDSIYLKNFFGYDTTIKGKIDLTTGLFELEQQLLYKHPTYGNVDFMACDIEGNVFVPGGKVPGKVENGTVTIGEWVALIMEGEYKNYSIGFGLHLKSDFRKPNATMTSVALDTDSTTVTESYNILAEKVGNNAIDIYNLAETGAKVTIYTRSDKSCELRPVQLFSNSYGSFFCYPADWNAGMIYPQRSIKGTTEGKKLNLGNWAIYTSSGKYYYGRYKSSEIAVDFDITYPPAQTAAWSGTGTEADPYLITSAADLFALSEQVNSAEIPEGEKNALAFKGKYFKQTNAINLKGYLFDPIGGNDDHQRFAGIYDGGKKAISGLTVNTGTRGYAGLFGAVDTVGVIKNVTLSSPNVTMSGYYYAGAVAAYCQGKVENCQVTNGNITGHLIVGGVCGSAGDASDLSFTGNVTGTSNVGGVIGNTRFPSTRLSATNTTVTVYGGNDSYSGGGVTGYLTASSLNGPTTGSLSDSYFSGKVVTMRGGIYAGGISGISTGAPISRCFTIGEIVAEGTTSQSAIGGIVGAIERCVISDCFFGGNMEVSSSWGGSIAGYSINAMGSDGSIGHSEIRNCIVTGHSRSLSTQSYAPYLGWFDTRTYGEAPTIINCHVDASLYPRSSSAADFTQLSDMISGTAFEGYDAAVWNFTKGFYPYLKTITDNTAMKVARAPMIFEGTDNVENVSANFTLPTANSVKWQVEKDGKAGTEGYGLFITGTNPSIGQLNGAIATDTIIAGNGNIRKWMIVRLAPASMFEGDGTEENPYKISTKADLIRLSEATTKNLLTFDGAHFLVTNDMYVEGDKAFLRIKNCSSSTYKFGGILDGGNHTLHGIKLIFITLDADRKITGEKPTYRGFIGRMKAGAAVKNLRMGEDCEFAFYSNSGVFVAENYGEIINCRNYAPMKAYAGTSGGICGYNRGVVKDCFNAGKVTAGFHYVGGIASYNYGLLENSQNSGEVTIEDLSANYDKSKYDGVGGIVLANFGKINNCLNTGYIHAEKTVGGLVGWFNTTNVDYMIQSSLNLGLIKENTNNFRGEIVGHLYKEKPIENCYWDSQLSLEKAAQGADKAGAKGLTTAELTSGKALEGFNADYWDYKAGRYPMLKSFLDEPIAVAAAEAVVDFGDSENRATIKNDSQLAAAGGMTWSVKGDTTAFNVNGTTLELHAYKALADTLVVNKGKFTKEIPLTATPDSLSAPEIEITAGSAGKFIVTFTHESEGVSFYYTLDGSNPTMESASTQKPIEVGVPEGKSIVVNAIAFHRNFFTSPVASKTISHTSGIDDIDAEDIESVMYVNAEGLTSDKPFEGINIVVVSKKDGSRSISKLHYRE